MITYRFRTSFFALILSILSCAVSSAQTSDSTFLSGVIYVKVEDTSAVNLAEYTFNDPALNLIFTTFSVDSVTAPFPGLNAQLDRTFRMYFSEVTLVTSLISDLEKHPSIEYAEQSPIYQTSHTPNDLQSTQWSLKKIQAEKAWDVTKGGTNIVVAIVDNAVSTIHEDLKANIWVNSGEIANNGFDDDLNGYTDDINGYDVADGDANPNPPSTASNGKFNHGTMCAGITSAVSNNGKGIASLGYSIKIMAVKCSANSAADEGNTITSGYDGVYYAIRAEADVISLSWGGPSGIFITGENIVKAANQVGIVVVAAAGNSNTSDIFYPAGYSTVIAVGATDENDKRANFSNYGSYIDVMAPGINIQTINASSTSAYSAGSGTSMSCPLVAALCGLIRSQQSGLNPSEVKSKLQAGCDNIDAGNSGFAGKLGSGRINAFKTLNSAAHVEKTIDIRLKNPMSGGDELTIPGNEDIDFLEVLSLNGVVLHAFDLENSNKVFQLPHGIQQGFYLIRGGNDNSVIVLKVFVHE